MASSAKDVETQLNTKLSGLNITNSVKLPAELDIPKMESTVLAYWKEIDAFKKCLEQSKDRPLYTFFDGPPFATGLPHYGHILAGTIKDTVTRYAHQSGFHVERRFGWDCHGLPVEHEIDKLLNITGPNDVMKIGIDKYNDHCRSIVNRYSSEWERIITRLGRWIDFKNDYKTMYPSFMESVWWVFKQIYKKDLVYHGYRVMPFSTKCHTPLSNFEANQNYKEVSDPSVVVSFPLAQQLETSFLAWTTTPWTLVSNMNLIVNPKSVYCKVKMNDSNQSYILMKSRLSAYLKNPESYTIVEEFNGEDLEGLEYVPCFEYFLDWRERGAYRVLKDDFVSESDGTGIVQSAPAFGEDDYRVCLKYNVCINGSVVPCPIDTSGLFTEQIPEYSGMYFKDADKPILKALKTKSRIFGLSTIHHNYPFCWRSDTPLMYRIVPSWFIKVTQVIPKLLDSNQQTYWVPDTIKEKRFHNWLENARDWNISRNRYWGTPIPIWTNSDLTEVVVIGSIQELADLSGVKATDLHREFIDKITIPSKKNPNERLKRIDEVFDCWFESGSMPYAQSHYPFENADKFQNGFPADFIAEGIDQTRGWFYTLIVISSILFEKPAFKNLIVNGLVLASDGQKMSKRKKNYPDPMEIVNHYGADALRLYLINSPVVRAENLKFNKSGVQELIRGLFLPWFNSFKFLIQNIEFYSKTQNKDWKFDEAVLLKTTNFMDRWILSYCQSLINFVDTEMKAYRLYTVVPRIITFLNNLTNWYIRFNRKRLKGDFGTEEQLHAITTLYKVQYTIVVDFAAFIPFMSEYIYQNLRKYNPIQEESVPSQSVHFLMLPKPTEDFIDQKVEKTMLNMQTVIDLARVIRDRNTLPVKQPLREIVVIHPDEKVLHDVTSTESYILDELNMQKLTVSSDLQKYGVKISVMPDLKALGKRLRGGLKDVVASLKSMTFEELQKNTTKSNSLLVNGHELLQDEFKFVYSVDNSSLTSNGSTEAQSNYSAHSNGDVVVLLDLNRDTELIQAGIGREIINRIQKLRKASKVTPTDEITVVFNGNDDGKALFDTHYESLLAVVKQPVVWSTTKPTGSHAPYQTDIVEISSAHLEIMVCPRH